MTRDCREEIMEHIAGYSLLDQRRNEYISGELKVDPVENK
jgi:hypothetical protein